MLLIRPMGGEYENTLLSQSLNLANLTLASLVALGTASANLCESRVVFAGQSPIPASEILSTVWVRISFLSSGGADIGAITGRSSVYPNSFLVSVLGPVLLQ